MLSHTPLLLPSRQVAWLWHRSDAVSELQEALIIITGTNEREFPSAVPLD